MKRLIFSLLLFSSTCIFSQQGEGAIVLAQLFVGMEGVQPNEQVTHYIDALGYVWTKSGSTYPITYDSEVYNNSATSTGNASINPLYKCADFCWNWMAYETPFALGVYKITNSKDNSQFFYLDCRDNEWVEGNTNPDLFFFIYDNDENNIYRFRGKGNFDVYKGQVLPSGILGTPYKTDKLQNFWNNALVLTNSGTNKVSLIWGKHPSFNATHYKVYRALSDYPANPARLNFSLYYTISSNTFDMIDPDFTLDGSTDKYVYYYIKAYNYGSGLYSSATNTVSAHGNYAPMKRGFETKNETTPVDYSLNQNYPNPFNPVTIINYTIAEKSFVNLKIYDILGNEVLTLVSTLQEKGSYSIKFDAEKLSSGIYIARIVSNNFSKHIKMILQK